MALLLHKTVLVNFPIGNTVPQNTLSFQDFENNPNDGDDGFPNPPSAV